MQNMTSTKFVYFSGVYYHAWLQTAKGRGTSCFHLTRSGKSCFITHCRKL